MERTTLIHCNSSEIFSHECTYLQHCPCRLKQASVHFLSSILEDYFRSTMSSDRLNRQTLMFIHREMTSVELTDLLME